MTIPTYLETSQSEIGTYWMDPEGFLVSISNPVLRTVENIKANAALVRRITGGKPVPHLVYLCSSPIPSKETRDYVTKVLPEIYTAMAMVSDSGLGTFITNLLFRFKPQPIPMKSFSDDGAARTWIKQFVNQ